MEIPEKEADVMQIMTRYQVLLQKATEILEKMMPEQKDAYQEKCKLVRLLLPYGYVFCICRTLIFEGDPERLYFLLSPTGRSPPVPQGHALWDAFWVYPTGRSLSVPQRYRFRDIPGVCFKRNLAASL